MTTIPTVRLEWHILTLEATPERARSIWQNEQLVFYKELLTRRDAEAREGWVSVGERLPDNSRTVLVRYLNRYGRPCCKTGCITAEGWAIDGPVPLAQPYEVVAWHEIPPPPSTKFRRTPNE